MSSYAADFRQCTQLIADIGWNAPITNPYLLSVLRHHPQWAFRTGNATYALVKERNAGHTYKIVTRDRRGTFRHVIGLAAALAAKHGTKHEMKNGSTRAKYAFRTAIYPQILHAKMFYAEGVEVDHVIEFNVLLQRFLDQEGLSLEDVKTTSGTRGFGTTRLTDQRLRARWCLFHQQNAVLEVVTKEQHEERTRARRLGTPYDESKTATPIIPPFLTPYLNIDTQTEEWPPSTTLDPAVSAL